MFTRSFWIEASERALKTLAQTFLALVAAQSVFDALQADWQTIAGVSIGAALLSYATSIVSAEVGHRGTPSLVQPQSPEAIDHWADEAGAEESELEADER
jgi:hypothetical protein